MVTWEDIGTPVAETPTTATTPPGSRDIQRHVDALIQHESGGDPTAVGDSGLALGLGQMHPEVRKAYGVAPESTPEEQRAAVTSYFTDLWNKHGGNVDDVLSEYHLGATNFERDRNSPENLEYLARYKKRLATPASMQGWEGIGTLAEDVEPAEKAAPPSVTTTPTSTTPPPPEKGLREMTDEEAGVVINRSFGKPDEHWIGRYTAILGKKATNALQDFYDAVLKPPDTSHAGFVDHMLGSLAPLRLLAVPAEAAADVAYQALKDSGLAEREPTLAAIIPVTIALAVGAKTPLPLPAGKGVPPKMPLQGTVASRAASEEAAAAAGRGTEWAGAARAEGEAVAASAAKEAEGAATAAEAAAAKTVPSAEAATKAKATLTPAGVTTEQGGQAARAGLEARLAEVKEPVQGIYNSIAVKNANVGLGDPAARQAIVAGVDALEAELGPTFSGQVKTVLTDLRDKINKGELPTYSDLELYKQQLDTLLPGRLKPGSTPKVAALHQLKWDIRDTMRALVGAEDRQWLEVADTLWRTKIIGKDDPVALGNLVRLVKKTPPEAVVERLFGNGTTDKAGAMAKAVMHELGDHPSAEALRQSVFSRLIGKASDAEGNVNPTALLKSYDALSDGFRGAMATPGAETFFKVVRQEQAAAERAAAMAKSAASRAKTVSRAGKAATTEAERIAAAGTKEAEAKAAEAALPNRLARFMAKGLVIGGSELAGRTLGHFPGGGLAGWAGYHVLLPTEKLATFLANSKTANLLARALKTPADSAVVPVLIEELKKSGVLPQRQETP